MQSLNRARRRKAKRIGLAVAVAFIAAQFRPATGKGSVRGYVLRDRARDAVRKALSRRP